MKTLIAAIAFAAAKHRNQRRDDPDATPYINHPLALVNVLANEAGVTDEQVLIAAVLHDTIEDTDTTAEEIASLFGQAIADIVLEVSDDKSLPKAERKRIQIARAPVISRPAQWIKLADKISNLRDIVVATPVGWSVERCRDYFDWAKAVIDGLRGAHPGLEQIFDEVYQARDGLGKNAWTRAQKRD